MSDRLSARPSAPRAVAPVSVGAPQPSAAPADPAALGPAPANLAALGMPAVGRRIVGDVEPDNDVGLAGDQPAWQRDAVSVSARVRALLATLRPVVVQVLTFWDHAVRSVRIGNRVVEVDPSGCYRVR